VVKLADAPDSKSGGLNARVGSIPSSGTISIYRKLKGTVRENSGRVRPGFSSRLWRLVIRVLNIHAIAKIERRPNFSLPCEISGNRLHDPFA
jgi:hypothetical protein